MVDAYPLSWPADYPRSENIKKSKFRTTLGQARDFVAAEIGRLKGKDPVISTNIPLKDNGELRADWTRYKLDDQGAAVYFTHKGNQVVLCCDTYKLVAENLHAIGRTIEALRQIDRDGVSDFLNRSFTGFKAIPEKTGASIRAWYEVLGISQHSNAVQIKDAFMAKAKVMHPDAGGDAELFHELAEARNQALSSFKEIA